MISNNFNKNYLAFDQMILCNDTIKTLFWLKQARDSGKDDCERKAFDELMNDYHGEHPGDRRQRPVPCFTLSNLFVDLFEGVKITDGTDGSNQAKVVFQNKPLIKCNLRPQEYLNRMFPFFEYDGSTRMSWFFNRQGTTNKWANDLYAFFSESPNSILAKMEESCQTFLQDQCSFDKEELDEYLYDRSELFIDKLHEIEEEVSQQYKDYGTMDKEVGVLKELLKLQKGHTNKLLVSVLLLAALRWKHVTYSTLELVFKGSDGARELSSSDNSYLKYVNHPQKAEAFSHLLDAYKSNDLTGSVFEKEVRGYYAKTLLSLDTEDNYESAFAAIIELTQRFPKYGAGFYLLAKCYKEGKGCVQSDVDYKNNLKKAAKSSDASALLMEAESICNKNVKESYNIDIIIDLCLNILEVAKQNAAIYGKAAFVLGTLFESQDKEKALEYYKLSAASGYENSISKVRGLEKKKRIINDNSIIEENSSIKKKYFLTNCPVNQNVIFENIKFDEYNVYSIRLKSSLQHKTIPDFLMEHYSANLDLTEFPQESIFAFCSEDETQNINDSLLLLDYLYNQSIDIDCSNAFKIKEKKEALIKSIKIFVSANYNTASMLIDASLADMGVEDDLYFQVNICDKHKNTARWLLSAYPLFVPCVSDNTKKVNLITLGSTPFLYNTIKEAMSCCYMSKCTLTITAIDTDISLMERQFKQEASGLYANPPIKNKLIPEFISLDLLGPSLENSIANKSEEKARDELAQGNYFVVDVGSDFENIKLARRLRTYFLRHDRNFRRLPFIAVRITDPRNAYLAERLTVGNKAPDKYWYNNYNLCVFCDCAPSFGRINLIEKLGMNIHLSYYGKDKVGGIKTYYRHSYNRDSSEAAAVSLIYRMFDCDIMYQNCAEYSEMNFEKLKALAIEYSAKISNDDFILNQCAAAEQTRFNWSLLVNGWNYADPSQVHAYMSESKSTSHKQELAKLHPFLFDFDEFTKSREEGSKFDILKSYLGDSNLKNPKDSTIGAVKNVLEYFKENDSSRIIDDIKDER